MKTLVETINFLKKEIDGKQIIERDEVYKMWLVELELEENEKVFASYIHQLIQFAFLDRMNVKEKKEISTEQLKKMIEKQMKMLKLRGVEI